MTEYEQTLRNQVTELDNMERAGIFRHDIGMKVKAEAERAAITAALDELARLRELLAAWNRKLEAGEPLYSLHSETAAVLHAASQEQHRKEASDVR